MVDPATWLQYQKLVFDEVYHAKAFVVLLRTPTENPPPYAKEPPMVSPVTVVKSWPFSVSI